MNSLLRLPATLATAALLFAATPMLPLAAQPAPPPQAAVAAPQGDPPARVGRLATINGTVSFRAADANQWDPATPNYPLTSGNSVWTEPQASADIELGASRFTLDGGTEFDIETLDDHTLAAGIPQGRLYLGLRDLAPGSTVTLSTPRGTVAVAGPGRYLVVAGDASTPTQVTVVSGSAQVTGEGLSLAAGPGQTATVTGSDHFEGTVGPAVADPFLTAQLGRDRPPPAAVAGPAGAPGAVAPPPAVMQMTGSEQLLATGEWDQTPDYGPVWYPPVAADWVPYRSGHWAWVPPWGWTWVDNAPWGFAPFHYGRWAQYHGRWGWVPGVEPGVILPVYAPALVSWVGLGVGIGVGVGWIPLGFREPYRPWYHASPAYYGRVNGPHVVNINNVTINNYANRRAGTFGSAAGVAGDPRSSGHWQGMTQQTLASARPVAQVPVRPTIATPGMTPGQAGRVPLAPPPAGFAQRPTAPGPASFARPGGTAPLAHVPGSPGPAPGRPGFQPTAPTGAAHPTPAVIAPGVNRPAPANATLSRPIGPAPATTPRPMPAPAAPGLAAQPHPLPPPVQHGPTPATIQHPASPMPAVQHPEPVLHTPVPAVHPQPAPQAFHPTAQPAFHPTPQPMPQPHVEAARPVPPPHVEAPHPAPPPPAQHHACPPNHPNC